MILRPGLRPDLRRTCAALIVAAVPLAGLAATTSTPSVAATSAKSDPGAFQRVATYPVFQNVPAGVDPAAPTVAEISAASPDGRTVAYSDALGKRVGLLDLTNPQAPVGLGTIDLARDGHADDQPTSVAIVGDFLLVVIDSSGGDFKHPSGRLDVYRLADRSLVTSHDLGGQPDSIAISKDGTFAAIAMENQRDEEFKPAGLKKGDLPQVPAGFVQIVDLVGAPSAWTTRAVPLTQADGSALPSFVAAGLDTPIDPEPEYVSINDDNKLALSLQENNGVVIIDLATGTIDNVFSAGKATVTDLDVTKDGLFTRGGSIAAPREPDAIAWIGNDRVATANEGDWKGGTRGWTIFDATTGAVTWDAGNSFERIADRLGLHNEDRATKKGAEPEGLTVATIGGKLRAFVGSERSNFVAVYDVSGATPIFEQALPTTNGPEGLLAIESRDLFVVSSETDNAAVSVRASVGVYGFDYGAARTDQFPSLESAHAADGAPIGWGALGALTGVPKQKGMLYAAGDSAYKTGRIYTVDTTTRPATITDVVEVTTADGSKPALDIEGIYAAKDDTLWLAIEGKTGPGNKILQTTIDGRILQEISLPSEISQQIGKWGLEGITGTGAKTQNLYVVVQRPLWKDPTNPAAGTVDGANETRVLRYQPKQQRWTSYRYQLEATSTPGDWMGLSEITSLGDDRFAVIERDKLNGPAAKVKRVYSITIGDNTKPMSLLNKSLLVDVLPKMRATNGWTQEKLEGLALGADGQLFAVTDNDGLVDATGETVFLRLGRL